MQTQRDCCTETSPRLHAVFRIQLHGDSQGIRSSLDSRCMSRRSPLRCEIICKVLASWNEASMHRLAHESRIPVRNTAILGDVCCHLSLRTIKYPNNAWGGFTNVLMMCVELKEKKCGVCWISSTYLNDCHPSVLAASTVMSISHTWRSTHTVQRPQSCTVWNDIWSRRRNLGQPRWVQSLMCNLHRTHFFWVRHPDLMLAFWRLHELSPTGQISCM